MLAYKRTIYLEVIDYSDADVTGCLDSKKSTLGCIFMLAGGVVSWMSMKQNLTINSTMEVELVPVLRPLHMVFGSRVL